MSSQGGSYTFRYTFVSSGKFEPAQLTRTGWEQMTPLESDTVSASATPNSDSSASFLVVDNPDVVSTWKRAEDGRGSIVRLTEIAGRTEGVHINTPHLHLQRAQRCSLVEDCAGDLAVHDDGVAFDMKPFEILTLRLETRPEK
jgi:alpha-mannosidase